MRRAVGRTVVTALVAAVLAGTAVAVGPLVTATADSATPAERAAPRAHRVVAGADLPPLAPGDEVTLAPGRHAGPWRIGVPDVAVRAEPGATLDGGGGGSALTLLAPGITVAGLEVRNVGPDTDLYAPDAAFRLDGCHGCRLVDVRAGAIADGVSAALWVEASDDVRVTGLRATGSGAGPGVTSFEAPGLTLEDVRLDGFLDGLYLERSDGLLVRSAELVGSGRYGVHLMFNRAARLERVRVADGGVGSAVMYGRDTVLRDVVFEGHRGPMAFGLLVQEERGAVVEGATLRGNTIGLLAVAAPGLVVRGADLDANGFGAVLQRLPAAFDGGEADLDTALTLEASRFRRNAFDVALDDDRADVVLVGNAFDRAAPLDLDGDGILDAPHVAGTSLGALAARVPDVSLLAFGPAMVLWEAFEARVPGARFGLLVDHAPRAAAVERRDRAALTWALLLLPLAGAAWALRPSWTPALPRGDEP